MSEIFYNSRMVLSVAWMKYRESNTVKVIVLIIANTLNLGATILHLQTMKRHEFSYF